MKNFKLFFSTIVMISFITFLVSCQRLEDFTTPIFLGMEISSNSDFRDSKNMNMLGRSSLEDELPGIFDLEQTNDVDYYIDLNTDFYIKVRLRNPNNLQVLSFVLGEKFYQSYDFLETSTNEEIVIKIDGHKTSGIKEYVINSINYLDSDNLLKEVEILGNKTIRVGVQFSDIPRANIVNLETDASSVKFETIVNDPSGLIKDSGNHLKAVLYDGLMIVSEKDIIIGSNTVKFENLVQDKVYTVGIAAAYDLFDSNGLKAVLLESEDFRTSSIARIIDLEATHHEITFDFEINEQYLDGEIISLELFSNDQLVKSFDDFNIRTIENLYSNKEYQLKLTYSYGKDLIISDVKTIKTLEKATPEIILSDVRASETSVDFELDIIDLDKTLLTKKVELLLDNKVVQELKDDNYQFNNLTADKTYVILITYTYDLGDGNGVVEKTIRQSIVTKPHLELLTTNIINTSKITIGETVVIEATLDNPGKVLITHAFINGERVAVSNATTYTFVRIEMVLNDTYKGGETEFRIGKLLAVRDGFEREYVFEENNYDEAFVNGDVNVRNINIKDLDGNIKSVAMANETYNLEISLDNPSEYDIESITISRNNYNNLKILIDDLIVSEDKSKLTYQTNSYESNINLQYRLVEFEYTLDKETKVKSGNGISTNILVVRDTTDKLIYTAKDLQNLESGYSYKLANNIDLKGVKWQPYSLDFVSLDGNGFTISNLRMVETITDNSIYYGLFSTINNSIISNLSISDSLIMLTINKESDNYLSYRVGLLAGAVEDTTINNVNVDGQVSAKTNGNNHDGYTGGLVGRSSGNFNNIYADVIVTSSNYTGLVFGDFSGTINNVHAEGRVSGKFMGGIAGRSDSSSINNATVIISNDESLYESYFGGFLGNGYQILITNSYVNIVGLVMPENDNYYNYHYNYNYIIGNGGSDTTLRNVFVDSKVELRSLNNYSPIVTNFYTTKKDLADIAITKDLKEITNIFMSYVDLDLWTLTGDYPVLKRSPIVRVKDIVVTDSTIDFALHIKDLQGLGSVSSIELYSFDELVQTINEGDAYRFENLRQNAQYTIKVVYEYYFLGEDNREIVINQTVRTKENEFSPKVDITDVNVGVHDVNFKLDIVDEKLLGEINKVSLYDEDNKLVSELVNFDKLIFTDLLPNSTYSILVSYKFDLNDGNGLDYQSAVHRFKTNPLFEAETAKVLNTDAIYESNIIVLEIEVDNPNLIIFDKVKVNGNYYKVTRVEKNFIRVNIVVESNFGLRLVKLVVEEIVGVFEGEVKTYKYEELETEVYINGDIYLDDFTILDSEGNELEYIMDQQKYYVSINFYNPTRYKITEVLDETVFESKQNKDITNVLIEKTRNSTYNQFTIQISEFTYYNEYLKESNIKNVSVLSKSLPQVKSKEIRDIKTGEDLANIQSGYIYQLRNDIDLAGLNWNPTDFSGVIYGNNYKIKNLSIIKTYQRDDRVSNIGLFNNLEYALVRDLVLDNFVFVINDFSNHDNYTSIGSLAANVNYSKIENVFINSDISLETRSYYRNIGLFAGEVNYSYINNVSVKGNSNSNRRMGGFSYNTSSSKLTNININVDFSKTNNNHSGISQSINNSIFDYIVSNSKGVYYEIESFSNITLTNSALISTGYYGTPSYIPSLDSASSNNYTTYHDSNMVGIKYQTRNWIINWMKETYDSNIWDISDDNISIKQQNK